MDFQGGEKKKSEILQFLSRRPSFALFDEVDSGLDVDSIRTVAAIITKAAADGTGILLISHTPRLFERIKPHRVHVLSRGNLVASGGIEIVEALEQRGYASYSTIEAKPL